MKSVRTLIETNSKKYEHFAYYETIIDKIEQNIISQPDICIECCKSLIEGLSKTILKNLDATISDKQLKNMDFMPLFQRAINKLAEYEEIEFNFIDKSSKLVESIGIIRNERGDISHGRAIPKVIVSTPQLSGLIMQVTEALAFYVLEHFFRIDLSYTQELKYEDNMNFNLWLDESNPIGNLSYSRALFDQDNVSYFEELLEFQTEQEEETPVLETEEIE
jgi:hypothetical protein